MKEREEHIETKRSIRPQITTEAIDGVTIGRAIVPIRVTGGQEFESAFADIAEVINGLEPDKRKSLVHRLNHNNQRGGPIPMQRPVSAYFSLDTRARELIIEWGKINPDDQEAKLHTYLNRMIDYYERVKSGGVKLSSGHLAKLNGRPGYIALLDNLPRQDQPIEVATPMGKMVNTLHASGILPLDPEGFARPKVVPQRLRADVSFDVIKQAESVALKQDNWNEFVDVMNA